MPRNPKPKTARRSPSGKSPAIRQPNPASRAKLREGATSRERTRAPRAEQGSASARPANPPSASPANRPAHRWTFLTNHAHVLVLLKAHPELILREVAARVGITERAVQRIIQDLESAGFIQRQKVGRQNQYQVLTEQPLRHPIEAHRTIGDLLRLIND